MTDVLNAVSTIRDAAPGYEEADAYYRGEVGEVFASPAIRHLLRDSGREYRVNLARRVVDAVLDRLKIASVVVPDDETATDLLSTEVWERNRLGRVARTVNRSTLVYGDAYLLVWPSDDEDGGVDVLYQSPVTTRVFYDPEHPGRVLYAAKVWAEGTRDQEVVRATLYYDDRIERWVSRKGSRGKDEHDFEPYIEDGEQWPAPNPTGRVPFFHFRTDEPYGRPEHADAFGPQAAITKLVALQMTTSDFQGFPQRIALLDPAAAGTSGDNDPVWDDDDTADADDRLDSGPGTILQLVAKAVTQFPAADPAAFIEPLDKWIAMMATSTATPMRFLHPTGQIPSGEALRADEAPLSEKIGDRQTWLDDPWRESLVFAMVLAGHPIETVDVRWKPVQVVDDLAGWQTVTAKVAAGVPVKAALMEAGYRPEVVDDWDRGSEQTNLDTRIASLTKIGQALQYLGSAVQLGAIDQAVVATIIQQLLGEVVQEDAEPNPVLDQAIAEGEQEREQEEAQKAALAVQIAQGGTQPGQQGEDQQPPPGRPAR